ncbi:hypothetical protein [Brevibacterium casei]|uniref:Uncharacterized protein n=1 Tax=Brevibacterium casei CIP 102111 TaxID=1255625 RepID=A0A2H1JBW5_9MICO|nr:hypothetical protein [Brevibacterium casei]QPR38969.1 hypothetical protein I6G94_15740 [Brevibacterium casei]QPR43135.1 hypothetical protein I6G93_13385 [Brevibacterium casei]SMX84985.1 hypothetical protein BC102111_02082 [Brevibacterium casei CIP 102111]
MSSSETWSSVPATGSPQSPVGGMYKVVGSALTVVVIGGLAWGLTLTVIKAVAIFTG